MDEMKKEILKDSSSICSICYEELDYNSTIYVDDENDIICEECYEKEKLED